MSDSRLASGADDRSLHSADTDPADNVSPQVDLAKPRTSPARGCYNPFKRRLPPRSKKSTPVVAHTLQTLPTVNEDNDTSGATSTVSVQNIENMPSGTCPRPFSVDRNQRQL